MTSDWWLDHPVIISIILAAGLIVGAGLGIGSAYLTTGMHLVSPDNIPAGVGMGYGGPVFGTAVSALIIWRINSRRAGK